MDTLLRTRRCRFQAVILVLSLVEFPPLAARRPMGFVLLANKARLGSIVVQQGTSAYAGDSIATDAGGTLSLRLGTATAYFGGNTQATLEETEGRAALRLAGGRIGFAVSGEEMLLVHASGLWVRAQTHAATYGEVTLDKSTRIIITAGRGSLEVIDEGETVVIPPGAAYEFQEVVGVGADQVKKKKRRRVAAALLLIGGITTGVVLYNTHPGRNPVSPSVP